MHSTGFDTSRISTTRTEKSTGPQGRLVGGIGGRGAFGQIFVGLRRRIRKGETLSIASSRFNV